MSAGLPLMKNVLTPLAKSVLLLLGLTTAVSATDAAIQKKTFESSMTSLMISNEEMEDIMKIVKFLEEPGLCETIKNEAKEQKGGFLGILLGTLATSILGSMLAGKPKIPGRGVIRAGEGVIQAGERVSQAGEEQLKQVKIFNATSSFN